MIEEWRPVVGFEGSYEVSNEGRVRGLDRVISDGRLWKGRVLVPTVGSHGYYGIYLCDAGKKTQRTLHSVVCEAFHGPSSARTEVAHTDGDRLNCRQDNLSWKTRSANHADKKRHGTHLEGSKCSWSTIIEEDIPRIRDLRRAGCTQQQIGDWFGVNRRTIGRVLSGETWRHV